jgi:6-phosphogluconolactonase
MKKSLLRNVWARAVLVGFVATAAPAAHAGNLGRSSVGAVFVGTNHNNTHPSAPAGEPANQVVMYRRAADGTLTLAGRFNTGGQGSGASVRFAGDGLGSAHSVQLSSDHRFLFVVNAGSNSLSVFRIMKGGLELTDVEPTGAFPNSVTQRGKLVYVLNSAGDGSITGYTLSRQGKLTRIPGSTRPLQAGQDPVRPDSLFNPTQVSFTPDGRHLVVTIKDGPVANAIPGVTPTGPGRVLVFGVGADGRPSANYTQNNLNNLGPFGFSFDRRGNLLVALFVGGPNLTGSAGSFRINADGTLASITPKADNQQIDTCWIENNGRYAWSANYTSGTISSYRIGHTGSLRLLQGIAGITNDLPGPPGKLQGSTPLDLGVSTDGRFLYNVLPGSGAVAGWGINSDGSLFKIGEFAGLPDTVDGDNAPFEFGPGGSPAGIAVL